MRRIVLLLLFLFLAVSVSLFIIRNIRQQHKPQGLFAAQVTPVSSKIISAQTVPTDSAPDINVNLIPTLAPTPRSAAKVQRQARHCAVVPVLLYHHIQPQEQAIAKGQAKLSVDSEIFAKQMQYLVKKGYSTLTPGQFLSGIKTGSLPPKPILLTFDDGYDDFYTYAYPQLLANKLHATVFLATGLMDNSGYLSWDKIKEMDSSGLVTFANHTWSHKALKGQGEQILRFEIGTAQGQLEEKGLGGAMAFAYPYGSKSKKVEDILAELGFQSAFTTVPGWQQCASSPYLFHRNRIGNAALSAYGL